LSKICFYWGGNTNLQYKNNLVQKSEWQTLEIFLKKTVSPSVLKITIKYSPTISPLYATHAQYVSTCIEEKLLYLFSNHKLIVYGKSEVYLCLSEWGFAGHKKKPCNLRTGRQHDKIKALQFGLWNCINFIQ